MDRIIVNMGNVSTCSSLLHDARCEELTFEYTSKTLTMHVRRNSDISTSKNVIFEGVYAHNMISCDYWGPSPRLFDIDLITLEASGLYKQLTDEIKYMCYTNPFQDKRNEVFEARIQFISGDVLTVLCQNIIIESQDKCNR